MMNRSETLQLLQGHMPALRADYGVRDQALFGSLGSRGYCPMNYAGKQALI